MHKKNQSTPSENEQNQWFSVWFNTPYYHLLYNKRNYEEAEAFISSLIDFLKPLPGSMVLDLACGSGRHAITLNKSGLNVFGVDLSENSILEAKEFENSTLRFEVQDMRESYYPTHFNYIFNLFTSFGYFDTLTDDIKVLNACHSQLKSEGILVLDYFNTEKIIPSLPSGGIETRDAIKFNINKKLDGKHIVKAIDFFVDGKALHFKESVAAYSKADLESMIKDSGFKILNVFGSYSLEKYTKNSERVIIIAQKYNS